MYSVTQFQCIELMVAAAWGKTSGRRCQIGVMTVPAGKPRIADNIWLDMTQCMF